MTPFFRGATVELVPMRHRLEYMPVVLLVRLIGALPRPLARGVGIMIGGAVYHLHRRLRRVGMRNLQLAFPEKSQKERRKILRGVYVSLGRLLGEACLFPVIHTRQRIRRLPSIRASRILRPRRSAAKVCSFSPAISAAGRCGSFFHSLMGHPMQIVVRPLDNPLRGRAGGPLSRAARQHHDRQTGIRPRTASPRCARMPPSAS